MLQNRQAEAGSATEKSRPSWARFATIASAALALLTCILFAIAMVSNELDRRAAPQGGYTFDGPPPPPSMDWYAAFLFLLIGSLLALRKPVVLPLLLAWAAFLGVNLIHSMPILVPMFNNLDPMSAIAMIASERLTQFWFVGFFLALAGLVLRGKQPALTKS